MVLCVYLPAGSLEGSAGIAATESGGEGIPAEAVGELGEAAGVDASKGSASMSGSKSEKGRGTAGELTASAGTASGVSRLGGGWRRKSRPLIRGAVAGTGCAMAVAPSSVVALPAI
ncbi:hypothetical protein CLOP_g22722 [Closterium sp. NIES-67]|nr:hypothetical protein CLOP_g22722 [Closterium sp. NIES-67]